MGQLLRNRRLGRGCPDWIAVRRYNAHCREAPATCGGGRGRICHPTIAHFGAVLLLSAFLRAPWRAIIPAAALWGLMGLSGVVYAVIVARRMRVQTVYRPEFEDWLFHVLLASAEFAMLALSAFAASSHTREALFGVGAAALLLLFIGIHDAWDAVTYHVFVNKSDTKTERRRDET